MAKKVILLAGYGPGISSAVAQRFGREGFSVALVARNEERLAAGVKALREQKIEAEHFVANLGDPAAVRAVVGKARAALGPTTVLHWNASGGGAGDLLKASDAELRAVYDVPFVGLVAAVQEALPDLRKSKESAILVTNGGFAFPEPGIDAAAAQFDAMGLAIGNAVKHKTVGLLAAKLASDGIYVGEVVVMGTVKGTPWDRGGNPTIEGSAIAEKFWTIYRDRGPLRTRVGSDG